MKSEDTLRQLAAAMLFRRNAGLTSLESLVLNIVALNQGRYLNEIAQLADQTPDQTTKTCQRLARKNLIVCTPSVEDIRRKVVHLTPEGKTYIAKMLRLATRAARASKVNGA